MIPFRRALLRYSLAFLAGAVLAGCAPQNRFPPMPAGTRVLAFGDSVTFGTGAQPGQDWPTLLAAATGWQVHNAGIPGDTALNGQERLPGLLREHKPQLVIIEIGGNDFLRRTPEAEVKEALRRMVRAVRDSGAQAVLVASPGLSAMAVLAQKPSDAPLYAELGKEEGVPVIADVFSSTLSDERLRADPIHPNAEGYRRMADGIVAALRGG